MKTLIFITTTSLFINVHANCNLISNNDLLDKVDDWVVGQLPQNDPCFNIENWNIEQIVDLSQTFCSDNPTISDCNPNRQGFNEDLSNWNTASATSMEDMFRDQHNFTGRGLESWNTSQVESMRVLFRRNFAFNKDLSNWDTSKVTSVRAMFRHAESFQGRGVEHFDTSQVIEWNGMFKGAYSFNGDVSNFVLNVNAPNLNVMFEDARSFNGDLSNWNTASITAVIRMFAGATAFEAKGLENWQVSAITAWDDAFHDTPSISDCTKRKLYDAWSPQLGSNSGFFAFYGNWGELDECKESSALSTGMMLLIGGGAVGLIALLIGCLSARFCCRKSDKSNMVFYPTEHDVSVRSQQEIEMDIRAKEIEGADAPRLQSEDSLDAIKTPTGFGLQGSDDLTAV